MVKINGKESESSGIGLAEYLSLNGYNADLIAVEYNGEILSKREYANTVLRDGDTVEIVGFVGGG